MLRRPPTSIELKLDDIAEYEQMRQEKAKEQAKSSKNGTEVPNWLTGPKTRDEIFNRIGYVPPEQQREPSPTFR